VDKILQVSINFSSPVSQKAFSILHKENNVAPSIVVFLFLQIYLLPLHFASLTEILLQEHNIYSKYYAPAILYSQILLVLSIKIFLSIIAVALSGNEYIQLFLVS